MDDERDDGLGEWMPIGAVVARLFGREGQREDPPAVGVPAREECRAWEGRHAGKLSPRVHVHVRGRHHAIPKA